MSRKKLNRSLRLARRMERLGFNPRCSSCGEDDPLKLQSVGGRILCGECRLIAEGKEPFEDHHPAGRRNDPFTVRIPANDHLVLTDMQEDWPKETRLNPNGDFLHEDAARDRAIHNALIHRAEEAESRAEVKEALAEFLKALRGPDWWKEFQEWRKNQ